MKQKLSICKSIIYRRPKNELLRMLRWGPTAYFRCNAWARAMEASASSLRRPLSSGTKVIPCWFLTGHRFWYQTAYCAWTLAKHTGCEIELNMIDDGTLHPRHESNLRKLFPSGATIRKTQTEERINDLLPTNKFPVMRKRCDDYINIRKLIDVHLGNVGPRLVLDSDMLFLNRPDRLLDWVASPRGMCLMTDCVESYGYSRPLMESLAGATVPPKLNVGICGIRSECIDWEQMEHWCERLHVAEGTSYFLEQALVAMLAAKVSPVTVMPERDYITFPSQRQVESQAGVLQHYVADSKPFYFRTAWRKCK